MLVYSLRVVPEILEFTALSFCKLSESDGHFKDTLFGVQRCLQGAVEQIDFLARSGFDDSSLGSERVDFMLIDI